MQKSKFLLRAERLKEKLGKQDFYYDIEVFDPVTVEQAEATKNQKHLSEKQLQAIGQQTQGLRDSSQTTVQAIRESNNIPNKNIQKSNKEYDEITYRNNERVTDPVNSKQVDSSIVRTVSNLFNDKNKNQFSLEPEEGNPNLLNLFLINPHNPH